MCREGDAAVSAARVAHITPDVSGYIRRKQTRSNLRFLSLTLACLLPLGIIHCFCKGRKPLKELLVLE